MQKPYETFDQTAPLAHGAPADQPSPMARAGSEFAPHDANAPILTGIDIAAWLGIAVMTLGPLAAYAFGS